jgi:multicomponent Na+:H+ antiporter subunit A
MSLVWTLLVLVVAVAVTPSLTRAFDRNTGYPLALIYLVATAAFWPAVTSVMAGEPLAWSTPWVADLDVNLAFRADGIGVVFTLIALLIGAVVFAYSARYLPDGRHLSFYLVMAAFTLSMVGLVLADDLIVLFLCWELTSLASFLLIARSGHAGESASMRTLLITFVGGLTMLAAVTAIIARTGTTSVSRALADPVWQSDGAFASVVAVLVLLSAFTKSAQFPFHPWLPDAMAASTPVSAYLHAAAVVKAGIFLMMRFTPAFYDTPAWNYTLIAVGLFTAVMGGWFAAQKTDLKKLMAYSTVSQLGLITATIGVGTAAVRAASVLHTIAHALFKSGLFMMVGVIDHAAHTRDVRRLPALRHRMPWSFAAVVLGCASMAGIPPMLGFVSKESIFTAMLDAPGPEWVRWAALAGAAAGSVLTFGYCAKVVFGAFVDGSRSDAHVHEASPSLLLPAALPILVSVPLALVVGVLDTPVGRAVAAALPGTEPEPHLTLWHGFTLELGTSALVIALGGWIIARRAKLRPRLEHDTLAVDGPWVVSAITNAADNVGDRLARLVRADNATRHLAVQLAALAAVLLLGTVSVWRGTGLEPATADLSRPIDLVVLIVIALGVLGVCLSDSRLAATVSLAAVGIAATVQIFTLGAPDVGLTQLLVEALTIIVIMLVLQKLPLRFGRPPRLGNTAAAVLAVVTGVAAGLVAFALTGRRERSELAQYYLQEGPVETGGDNVVNTILVEFRALDTLGELAVLGMAGVAIVAVLSTVRDRYLDPDAQHDRNFVPPPELDLRPEGSPAHLAMERAWGNAIPLQLLVRITTPLLALTSALLFWRGHNEPGGGFIAALVGSSIVALVYLSTAKDRQVGPPRLPVALIGGGILIAIGTGIWGLVAAGSFLEPLSGYWLGQSLTSAIVFDLGVYAAVLGLVMVAFNLLGTSEASRNGEGTRERADETVEGELAGPMDTSRGERPPGPTRKSRFIATGTPPDGAPR